MVNLRNIFAVLIVLFGCGAHANRSACISVYSSRSLIPIPWLVVHELAMMQISIYEMPYGEEKIFALQTYKKKFAEIKAIYGDKIIELVNTAINMEQTKLKEFEDRLTKAKQAVEQQIPSQYWPNMQLHPELTEVGPFLNDSQMFGGKNGNLVIYDYKQKKIVSETDVSGGDSNYKVSKKTKFFLTPNKRYLILASSRAVTIIDHKDNSVSRIPIPSLETWGFSAIRLSKNGNYLFMSGLGAETKIFSVPQMTEVFSKIGTTPVNIDSIVESADGHYVFFAKGHQQHVLYDLKNRKEIELLEEPSLARMHISDSLFSADSKVLSVINNNHDILDFNVVTGKFQETRLQAKSGKKFASTADGQIAYIKQGLDELFNIVNNVTGENVYLSMGNLLRPTSPSFTGANNNFLVFKGSKVAPMTAKTEERYLYTLDLHTMTFNQQTYQPISGTSLGELVGLSPDGKSLFFKSSQGDLVELY